MFCIVSWISFWNLLYFQKLTHKMMQNILLIDNHLYIFISQYSAGLQTTKNDDEVKQISKLFQYHWQQIDLYYPQKHHRNNNLMHIPVINVVMWHTFLILKQYRRKIKKQKFLWFPSTSSKNSRKCSDFVILFLSIICWYAQTNTPALFFYYWIFNHSEIILWNSFKVFQNLQKLEPPQNRANFAESLN